MVALLKDISLAEPVRRAPARTGADHLYSTAAITNSAGSVVERYGYDAYGKRVALNPDGSAKTGNAATVVGFTGRTLDAETGLWYFRARYFTDSLNRFIGRDPMGYNGRYSLYHSFFAPNYLDPTGEIEIAVDYTPKTNEEITSQWAAMGFVPGGTNTFMSIKLEGYANCICNECEDKKIVIR